MQLFYLVTSFSVLTKTPIPTCLKICLFLGTVSGKYLCLFLQIPLEKEMTSIEQYFLRIIAYISFCGQPWTSLFCIHKHDWLDCRALHNREAVFTWKRGCKKNIIVSMGYRLHLPNMTSPERLWNQPGDYSQSQRRNIRMSMIEYTVFLWLAYM